MEEKILNIFRKDPDGFISGEDISESLKISRSAVWKHIEKLRELGYEFDAVPHLGYRLKSIPDRLYSEEISYGMGDNIFGRQILYYSTLDSTNTTCFNMAVKGSKEGTVVISEGQTKGKGRLSREWISPKHRGIYMSVLLRPQITPFQAPRITLTAAVSTALAIREATGCMATIKWPNDILVDGKKLGGILTEMDAESDMVNFIVVGIGINVNTKTNELPKGATSIYKQTGAKASRIELVRKILQKLQQYYILFSDNGFDTIRDEWQMMAATLGKRVRASCMNKKIEGEAVGIDADGALIIRLDNGFQEKILAGDILLLR